MKDETLNKAVEGIAASYQYPICPECACNTIALFSPPREGIVGTEEGYNTIGTAAYVDWDKAHLYCTNGATNCHFNTLLSELTTPIQEPRHSLRKEWAGKACVTCVNKLELTDETQ